MKVHEPTLSIGTVCALIGISVGPDSSGVGLGSGWFKGWDFRSRIRLRGWNLCLIDPLVLVQRAEKVVGRMPIRAIVCDSKMLCFIFAFVSVSLIYTSAP